MSYGFLKQSYGKSRVRVTKVHRDTDFHEVVEFTCEILLDGDFESSYTASDNSLVVPTDTIKNTVYVLARNWQGTQPEEFGLLLARHFLKRYDHVTRADVQVIQTLWQRIEVNGQPHAHSFVSSSSETRSSEVTLIRNDVSPREHSLNCSLKSSIRDLVVLKTTQSGFSNYWKDENTTLQDTADRIFATSMTIDWDYAPDANLDSLTYQSIYNQVRTIVLEQFALHFSPSVQRTIYEVATEILNQISSIATVEMRLPNQHRILANLAPFQLDNPNTVFIATDEPHGTISARIARQSN